MSAGAQTRGILGNAGFGLLGRVVTSATVALAGPLIARNLGESAWGEYALVFASLEVFRPVAGLGLDMAVLRTLSVGDVPSGTTMRAAFSVRVLSALAAMTLLIGLTLLYPPWRERLNLIAFGALSLLPFTLSALVTARFQAAHGMHFVVPAQLAAATSYLVGLQFLLMRTSSVYDFLALQVTQDLVLCAALLISLRIARARIALPAATDQRDAPVAAIARQLVRYGLPLAGIDIVVIIYSRLNLFLLEGFKDKATVGRFNIAFQIATVLAAIGGSIALSAVPVLSRLASSGQVAVLRQTFKKYSLGSAIFSCSVAALMTLLAPTLLRLVRPEFAAAAPTLAVLAWASVFRFQNQLSSSMFYAFGKFHWGTACALFNLCTFSALAFTLIPRYGTIGAALATFGMEGINALNQLLLVRTLLKPKG